MSFPLLVERISSISVFCICLIRNFPPKFSCLIKGVVPTDETLKIKTTLPFSCTPNVTSS